MAEEIKVGDVVMLKSGGPKMTVGSIEKTSSGPYMFCYWFGEDKEKTGKFPGVVLTILDEDDG